MKGKSIFVSLILAALLCSCSKQLNISIEYNSRDPKAAPILYWVNNDTGADIPKVTFLLNNDYMLVEDVPSGGTSIILTDFAKKNGERFNIIASKPMTLKAKANGATYSVNFDDISLSTATSPSSDFISRNSEIKSSWREYNVNIKTTDGHDAALSVAILCDKELNAAVVKDFLTTELQKKSSADMSPVNEDSLCAELKSGITELAGPVQAVLFSDVQIN